MTRVPAPPPQLPDEPPAARPRREWGTYVAWAVILVCVALVMSANIIRPKLQPTPKQPIEIAEKEAKAARQGPDLQMVISGRYAIGARRILQMLPQTGRNPADETRQLLDAVRENAKTPADKLRAAAVIAELEGKPAALEALDGVGPLPPSSPLAPDADALRTIYTTGPDAVPADVRQGLIDRHGWFGRLALSTDKPPDDPLRESVMYAALTTAGAGMAFVGVLLAGGLTGLVLFVIAIVALAKRRVRLAYSTPPLTVTTDPAQTAAAPAASHPQLPTFPPPGYGGYAQYGAPPAWGPPPAPPYGAPPQYGAPGMAMPPPGFHQGGYRPPAIPLTTGPLGDAAGRTGPFLEAFALYLAAQIVLGLVLRLTVREPKLWMEFFMLALIPLVMLWPRWRGVSWADLRRGLGWHTGRGVAREAVAGLLGYVGGLPVFAVGVGIAFALNKLAGAERASHPIELEFGKGWLVNLELYVLACVWALLVEETMFRGAFFHHLRRRWNWAISACSVAFIFAAIHPQGWTAIPALASLAVVFAGLREWRGSIVAPVTAHFLNNFTVVTLMILMVG